MMMGQLFKATISAALLLGASAQAARADPFTTTDDYVRGCSATELSDDCYGGYEAALVFSIASHTTANTCPPSQSGTANGDVYKAAENVEISRMAAWLKKHSQAAHQDYRKGLEKALVANYPCK